jgi:heptosyltransferase-2
MRTSFLLEEQPLPPEARQRFQDLRVMGRAMGNPEEVANLLVRAPNWVGDAVMSLPTVAGLGRFFPRARITVLATPRVVPLFAAQPGVAETISYPAGRGKWQVLWGLRGRFDLALILPNSMESALGIWLAGVPVRVGYDADVRRPFLTRSVAGRRHLSGLHTVYYFLGLLTTFGEVTSFTPPRLSVAFPELQAASELLAAAALPASGPWVGLSPGAAYGPAKRWPPERFAALATALQEEFDARIVLLGGPQERPMANMLKDHFQGLSLDLVGRTDLRRAMGLLSQLKLLITNDSGLMHVAAALGVPLIALFGSTDPVATGPFTSRATVLHHPLPCSPCFKRTCDLGYPCLTAISVPEALAAARPWLTEGA